jgi:hypothetical protein
MTAVQYISQLGTASGVTGTDIVPITQGSTGAGSGTTKKATVAQFYNPTFTLTGTTYASGINVTVSAKGSGTNGPATAQVGHTVNISKPNWYSGGASCTTGEVDGIYVVGRQGGIGSDMSGILVDVQRTSTSSGFLNGIEMSINHVDVGSNTINYGMDTQIGVLYSTSPGVLSDRIGYVAAATYGTLTAAFQSQSQVGSSWNYHFAASVAGVAKFQVTGAGDVLAANSYHIGFGSGSDPFVVNSTGDVTANSVTAGTGGLTVNAGGTKFAVTGNAATAVGSYSECAVGGGTITNGATLTLSSVNGLSMVNISGGGTIATGTVKLPAPYTTNFNGGTGYPVLRFYINGTITALTVSAVSGSVINPPTTGANQMYAFFSDGSSWFRYY